MAVIECLNIKKGDLKGILAYVMQDSKTNISLMYGKDCSPETAYDEFIFTKKLYAKEDGRKYYHFIQSFDPKDNVDVNIAHNIGKQFIDTFKGYQVVCATHKDKLHIHNHFVINSVNFENGYKYLQSKQDMQKLKDLSDKLCIENNLSVIENKSNIDHIKRNEYRVALKGESWKFQLINAIDYAMKNSNTKDKFIEQMNSLGYNVNWSDTRKYITYTTPNGNKCRDNKLHDEKYLKEGMELYYGKFKTNESNTKTKSSGEYISNRLYNEQSNSSNSQFGRFSRTNKENINRDEKYQQIGAGYSRESGNFNTTLSDKQIRETTKGSYTKNKVNIFSNWNNNSNDNITNNNNCNEINRTGLSKQAKKELAIKLKNATGFKWDIPHKRYTSKANSMGQTLSDIIVIMKTLKDNENENNNNNNTINDFGSNAKKEYAREKSYSSEEWDMEM